MSTAPYALKYSAALIEAAGISYQPIVSNVRGAMGGWPVAQSPIVVLLIR